MSGAGSLSALPLQLHCPSSGLGSRSLVAGRKADPMVRIPRVTCELRVSQLQLGQEGRLKVKSSLRSCGSDWGGDV